MKFKDTDGKYLLEKIRDTAGQKGTGKWTAIASLEYGVPVTLIGEYRQDIDSFYYKVKRQFYAKI